MSDKIKNENVLKAQRGGSSKQVDKMTLFGVECDDKFADDIARDLSRLCKNMGGENTDISILDLLPERKVKPVFDLNAAIDAKFGEGVSGALNFMGIKLTSAILCGCGQLGVEADVDYPNMICGEMTDDCKNFGHHAYQDFQPNVVASAIAAFTGNIRLGTDHDFLTMLGALAGYPFRCACGLPVACLDAPNVMCDFCTTAEGLSDFIKHMDEPVVEAVDMLMPGNSEDKRGVFEKMAASIRAGLGRASGAVKEAGSHLYALITEFITAIGNFFNNAFRHIGQEVFLGSLETFKLTMERLTHTFQQVLGADGFLFLFVIVVVAVMMKFGAEFVANFVISTTLSLCNYLKDVAGSLFERFSAMYKSIVDKITETKADGDGFVLHSSNYDGSTAMIATLFCTLASASGTISGPNIVRAIASARHVVGGVEVARSALVWLVDHLPTALQTFLWEATGVGTFNCKDEILQQTIVVMRESLLTLRKNPTTFLGDAASCKILLTAHTMLTRAVTLNNHAWSSSENAILRGMLSEAREFITRAQKTVDEGIGRVEPVGIILQGPPGIGKTALIEVLSAKLHPDVPRAARIYYKNQAERFWSGYCAQPVLVIDDYGAVKDDATEALLAADLLRIISPGQMALNMPGVYEKGEVYCSSDLVVMTTNRNMNSPQKCLENNKAFMRRFIYCTVTLKDEFKTQNGTVDTPKLAMLPMEEAMTFPHLKFRIHEKFSDQHDGRGLYELSHRDRTFEELLTVINAYMVKKKEDAQFLDKAARKAAPPVEKTKAETTLLKSINEQSESFVRHMAGADEKESPSQDGKTEAPMVGRCIAAAAAAALSTATIEDEAYGLFENNVESVEQLGQKMSAFEETYSRIAAESGIPNPDALDYDEMVKVMKPVWEATEAVIAENIREGLDALEAQHGVPVYQLDPHSKPFKGKAPWNGSTSGGNRKGKNTRRVLKQAHIERVLRQEEVPEVDEFGMPWASDDLAMRAAQYLNMHSKQEFVKPVSMKDQNARFKITITNAAIQFLSSIKDHPLRCLAAVTACATTVGLCIKAVSMFTEPTQETHMRTKYNSDFVRRRPNIAHESRWAPMVKHSLDSDTDKGVLKRIADNCGYVERAGGKVGCFFVTGNIFRTVAHFFRTGATSDKWLPDGTPFSVFAVTGGKMVEYKMSFSMEFVIPFQDKNGLIADWLYYNCGTRVPPKKDLTHLHLSENIFTNRRCFQSVMMVKPDGVSKGTNATVRYIAGSPAIQYSSTDGSRRPDVFLPRAILSNYPCERGDCGFPIVAKVDGKYAILSLHVGARSRPLSLESTSAVVTRSEVNMCLERLQSMDENFPITKHAAVTDVVESKAAVELNDAYSYLGKWSFAPPGIASKTKYKRSLIYDQLHKKIFYEPSIMGDKNDCRTAKSPREVLADIANRKNSSLEVMPKDLVRMAGDALFEAVVSAIPVTEETRLRTLTVHEALNGDGKFVDRYPTAGSPGLPWTLKRPAGVTGKHSILAQNAEGDWYVSDDECSQAIADLDEGFKQGVVGFYVNQFALKDETLKCDAEGNVKKTRGINCAPFQSNVLGKCYFGSMVCMFKQFFDRIPFKCGMNVFSSDWDDFIKYHLEVGDTGFDGDIGGQENIIKGEIYDELFRFTDRIYAHYGEKPSDEERNQRASYLASLCHHYVVIGPDLFRAKFGNPSGNWLTAFICSFTSGILLGVAYFGLARKHDPMKANVYSFLSLVRMSLSGDDNFVSRSSTIDWFTGSNVSKHLKEKYGYDYTDAMKGEVFPPDRKVVELNFLACNTRICDEFPGINYLAVIGDGPLEKCVQYISKKAAKGDEYIAISDNANTALDLVFTSGKKRFEKYRQQYLDAFVRTEDCPTPHLHDYAFCRERFLNKELLSEDYFTDDWTFVPHMLKAPDQVEPKFEDAQVNVEAGVETKTDKTVTYEGTERTVLEVAKRFSVIYDSLAVTSPVPQLIDSVSGAFITQAGINNAYRPMAGTLGYFAAPYAAWGGDLRMGFKCAGETLIRFDATERLANADSAPRHVPREISSMAPFDYTSANERWAMVQVPGSVRVKFIVLPKLAGEELYQQTTPASYVVETPQGENRPAMTIYAAAGDNTTFHFLFMVPSLLVRSNYYPHNRNYQVTLPEYLNLTHVVGSAAFPFSQSSALGYFKDQGVVDSDGTSVTSVIYRTEIFTDAMLVSLGVFPNAPAVPVNRRYDPGAVKLVECDLSNCVARSVEIEVQTGGASTGPIAFALDPTFAIARGTTYTTDNGVEAAIGWYLSYHAYANAAVRSLLNGVGIPTTEIVIPTAQSGYEHSPSGSFVQPATDTGNTYLGGTVYVWDSTTTFQKGFYDTPILPFKNVQAREDIKEDYDLVKHMDPDHGIGFSNVLESKVTTTDRKPNVARKEMGEENYSFATFADRFQLIRSFQWSTSQVQGTVLDSRTVPYQCIGSTTRAAFNKFCYWKGDVEVKVQIQATAFVAGKVTLVFAPLCDTARASYLQLPSLTSISVAPNVSLQAGNTTEVTMLIPYAHYKNYLNTDGEAGDPFSLLGTVSIVVFNKLRVGPSGVDYCTVNVYTRFRNSEFQMLRPPPLDGNVSNFIRHGGTISKNVRGVVDDVTDAVDRVGQIADYALDAPNVGVNYLPVFNRSAPMMNHSTNIHYLNVMDLHPGQKSLPDSKDVSSDIPECSLKYLLTKPSYLNTFTIRDGHLEGEVYMVCPLTPTMKLFNAPINSLVDETLMGYVAAPFKFWRGGFKFTIEVIATSVHTARLVVATHYGGASSSVSMDNILAQNAEVLEIGAGQNTFEVIVPWRVPTQWLEVPCGPPDNVNPFEVTSSARYTMGEVSIRLLTRLQTMQSVSPDIDCNVYVSMLDDAELAYVGMNSADLIPVMLPNQKIVP